MIRAALSLIALFGAVALFAVACGGDDEVPTFTRAPTATSAPTVAATATVTVAATDTPVPTETPAEATAAPGNGGPEVALEITVDGDTLFFKKDKFEVPAGSQVVLVFDNVSTVNQHNWVVVLDGTKDDVAARGTGAGPDNDWVEPGDPEVIDHTKLLDPGEAGDVRFAAPPPGTYQFVCTFPGHNFTMFGTFEVTS